MNKPRILITCPPMIRSFEKTRALFEAKGVEAVCAEVVQTLDEETLMKLLPEYDGWIIGDDPATEQVFRAATSGKLRAAVKWGVGVDNVDFKGAKACGLEVKNTPGMFGREVADVAMGYLIALARYTYEIDRACRDGKWIKPAGTSLAGSTVGLVGLGDIGRNCAKRFLCSEMNVIAYDPFAPQPAAPGLESVERANWPDRLGECDFLVLTCSLTPENRHMLNANTLATAKDGLRVVNVARGPLIDETALIAALESGKVAGAALEVFEVEPLPADSPLRKFNSCIFGSHNSSNTQQAVLRTSEKAAQLLFEALGI